MSQNPNGEPKNIFEKFNIIKTNLKRLSNIFFSLFTVLCLQSQNILVINAEWNDEEKKLFVQQEITFQNDSELILEKIILNDWNHAYSNKNSPLGERFSDEFVRSFHLAKDYERGYTDNLTFIDENGGLFLNWKRPKEHLDLIEIALREPLNPGNKITIKCTYISKIPSDKFTRFGHDGEEALLKNWFLCPARLEKDGFIKYSNLNLDDIANSRSDINLELKVPKNINVFSDLEQTAVVDETNHKKFIFNSKDKNDFGIYLNSDIGFESYKNNTSEVVTNLKDNRLNSIQKAVVIDRITRFVSEELGITEFRKTLITQNDYERNPFYGLNQLPAFISPFPDEFIYEIKFLKTYLNQLLNDKLYINLREDSWVHNGIQVFLMMKYIEEHHPDMKMLGNISKLGITKGYKLTQVDFNEQYSYAYMLMARKNLDQPIGNPKDTFIKFNEQIAGKYRAGLSLKYLDNYLEDYKVSNAIKAYVQLNQDKKTSQDDFENIIRNQTDKDLNWFFETIIHSRDLIDYKFTKLTKTKDSITFTLRNKTGNTVPIPIFGIRNNTIIFKEWIENVSGDSVFTLPRKDAEKIVINYKNEVPEYNLRNNWKSLNRSFFNHRPIKFNFLRDLEDPYVNQILFIPTIGYNLYDGLTPGIRFHNKTILDKPFIFNLNPAYSMLTQSLIGSFGFVVLENNRKSNLFQTRYSFQGSTYHYAPDASYFKLNPMVILRKRPDDFRDNKIENFIFRYVMVEREHSDMVTLGQDNENYSIFNAKYINSRTEIRNHFSIKSDLQIANIFGKISGEIEYRKLFDDNRQFNLRFFAGSFLYRKTDSEFFSFGLDRPTDYLYDYNLYGRSEESGFFSQQYVAGEGAFKSMFDTRFSNQWMTTINASFSIWNWVEAYGDMGFFKNENYTEKFVYDSGIRLNLVTDYFEVYFPVYSSMGWEIGEKNYHERIRFIITLSPDILIRLFTRKWF